MLRNVAFLALLCTSTAIPVFQSHVTSSDEATVKLIFEGVFKGFLNKEAPDVMPCVKDSTTTLTDFKAAVADFETKTIDGIAKALRETADGLEALKAAMSDCKAAASELQSLEAALAQMSTPRKLVYHVGKELLVNGKDILSLVEGAVGQYKAASWESFGEDLGAIVGDLVGKPVPNGTLVLSLNPTFLAARSGAPAAVHYEDPKPNGCASDEVSITIQGVAGDFCTPTCSATVPCPAAPAGISATPQCALQDASTHKMYCALICNPSGNDDACGENASCKSIQGTGICSYDD